MGFRTFLIAEMERYKPMLLQNPIILAAVYLDPRYQMSLNEDNRKLAISFLVGLNKRVDDLKRNTEHAQVTQAQNTIELDSTDAFRNFLQSMRGEECTPVVGRMNASESEVLHLLNALYGIELPLNVSILDYWNSQKDIQTQLFNLCSIIFSVAPTQTSVERAFSALALILTPLRSRLGDRTLKNILLIRLNHNLYTQIIST